MAESNKDLLRRLQTGGCAIPAAAAPMQTIILKPSEPESQECSKGTEAFIIDSNSLNEDQECAVEWDITNADETDVQLMIGIFGQKGAYLLDQPSGAATPNTTDNVLVTDGSGTFTPEVAYFNHIMASGVGVLVTGFEVEILNEATAPAQLSQNLYFVVRTLDATEQCKRKRFAPLCNECQDQSIKSFRFKKFVDALHDITYNIKAGAHVIVRLKYSAIGTGHAMVACD